MDAYLASGEIKSASHFYLNINFELLNGCKLKCAGCHVEKNAQNPIHEEHAEKLIKLLKSMSESFYQPFIAFIGPTDFLSADNVLETLSDSNVIKLLHHFKRLSLQTTYLELRKAEAVAAILKTHYQHLEIEINLVIDPVRMLDNKYLELLEKNKKAFLAHMGRNDIKSFGLMNVTNYEDARISKLAQDYDFMHERVAHLFETTIDYNFSYGRNPEMSNEDFFSLSEKMKRMFESSSSADDETSENKQYLKLSYGRLADSLIERQYTYRNGKLFYSPLLYERFVSFHDKFEVPLKNYTIDEVEQFEMLVQLNQYGTAVDNEECEACPLLSACVDRGILYLMNTYGTKKCVVAKNALFSVNTMGALPISGHRN